ncbi:hypothetical protein P167DRAFT_602586 [Morchella conica CCBAS932]|uniref:C3H1-type domain-containing protein n=1 Tax=Morchella conica CCBAS932 TaxID=1392247 RepID=A0A3N4L4F4_9PEZI|nr:hypothetical protein P167DRAFT_602586 [Morchella conica CCBAS932]
MMLFDDGDAALLKKWIVKRLEDISDADSDVLADYVLALLRHDQVDDEVKKLCIEQLDDFLREHTEQFVNDVFLTLKTKSFISVNSTLAGSAGVSILPPSPPAPLERESSQSSDYRRERDDRESRGQKRGYFDRDRDGGRGQDGHYGQSSGNSSRGFKAPRRAGASGPGRWTRGDPAGAPARGGYQGPHSPAQQHQQPVTPQPDNHFVPPPPGPPAPMPFAMPGMPPPPGFPWAVPNPNDPMAAFLAAQAAAAWGFPPVMGAMPGAKPGEEKKIVKKIGERCKDYDEKGFCMKGDMCPYEHGTDHIVVPGEDAAEEYDPNNSQLFTNSKAPSDRPLRQDRPHRGRGGTRGGRGGRSEISGMGPSYDRSNMTLVVEHIPDDKLAEGSVRDFFSSFGTVTNVDVQPHKHLATVSFERWSMAKKAYDSPAPIFDNRFVKVFWYKPEPGAAANPNGTAVHHASAEPTDTRSHLNDDEEIDMEEFKQRQEEAQKAYEAKMAKKKANEEAARELERRKEELLKLQMEEKRKLMEKLNKKIAGQASAAPSASPPPKMEEGAKSASPAPTSNGGSTAPKDAASTAALKAQLEALEAEARALGIEGNTGEEFDLEGFRGRGRGRGRFAPRGGRGGYIPRGRGVPYSPYGTYRGRGGFQPGGFQAARGRGGTLKLDNRPKRVAISAPDLKGEKDEDFRHYLMNTGLEVEGIEPHPEKDDTQIITFKDRRSAEQFVFTGSEIPNVGTVSLSWYTPPGGSSNLTPTFKPADEGMDVKMEASEELHHPHHPATGAGDHRMDDDSYDLAEDDEGRWLPE